MAERFAEELKISSELLPQDFTLSQVIAAYPRFREKRSLEILEEDIVPAADIEGWNGNVFMLANNGRWFYLFVLAVHWPDKTLKEEGFAGPTIWKAALSATESWMELLI